MSNPQTLLEAALGSQVPKKKKLVIPTEQEIELIGAWLEGKITTIQVTRVVFPDKNSNVRTGYTLYWIANMFRSAVLNQKIEIKIK